MADMLLKIGLWGLGLSAMVIGTALAFFGPHDVANFFASGIRFFHDVDRVTDLSTPNIESELRFFGLMFVFYGGVMVHTVKRLDLHTSRVPVLLGVFFLAGLARLKSYFEIGPPHSLFIGLMAIELGLPMLLFIFWKLRRKPI